MSRMERKANLLLSTLLPISLVILLPSFSLAQGPIQAPPSPNSYGPEGPWNTVRVYVGGERIDLVPGCFGGTCTIYTTVCENIDPCPATEAGLYANNTEALDEGDWNSFWFNDTFSFSPSGAPLVEYEFVRAFHTISTLYPNNLRVIPEFGLLDVGVYDLPYPSLTQRLLEGKKIQSASVSFHIGSATADIPISVWYGGYDASRIVGEPIIMDILPENTLEASFTSKILDIGIFTAAGATPVVQNTTGLLAKHNRTIATAGGLNATLWGGFPFMGLPTSVCQAISELLPVSYDLDTGLYIWDTSDSKYEELVRSQTYLAFTFEAAPKNPIRIPFSLLNLTLDHPFLGAPKLFFPCNPLFSTSFTEELDQPRPDWPTLGRAFLQGVNLGVNWGSLERIYNNDTTGLKWWIAEAPGPDFEPPSPVALVGDDFNVVWKPSVSWETSWSSYWGQKGSGGLSKGAGVGIGLGVGLGVPFVLALVGFFVWRWRRNKRVKAAGSPQSEYSYEKAEQPLHELDQTNRRAELYNHSNRHELDSENEAPVELE